MDRADVARVLRDMASVAPLTASRVVAAAAAAAHPLHDQFEWDDSLAAHQFRLGQARQIIVNVTEKPEGARRPIPVFIHVPAPTGEGAYVAVEFIVQHPDQLRLAQAQAIRYLKGAEDSVEAMTEAVRFHGGSVSRGMSEARQHIKRAQVKIAAAVG